MTDLPAIGFCSGREGDDGQFADQALAGGLAAVVGPADEPAQHASDHWDDQAVAVLVVGKCGCCLDLVQDAVSWLEPARADRYLECGVDLDVALRVGGRSEPGEDDYLAGGCGGDDFEHGLIALPGVAPAVGQAQEAVAEQPSGVPVS